MLLLIVLFFPLLAAVVTYLSGNKLSGKVALLAAAVEFVLSLVALEHYCHNNWNGLVFTHGWIINPNISFSIAADGLSVLLVVLTTFLVPVIILSSFGREQANGRALYSLVLLMQFALIGVFVATDGLLFYIFWELALIPIYFIALLWGDGRDKQFLSTATFKFFVYTLIGSLFMLVAFIFLYSRTGSLSLQSLYAANLNHKEQVFLAAAFFFAFAVKIPIFPFHTWQADTYKEAPTIGTMLLAGIMLKMGLYGLLRWLLPVVPDGVRFFNPLFITLSVIGIVYGSILAIQQKDIKRLLAYSSFAHVGLIAAGIFSLTIEGLQGAVVQMLAHGVNVVGAFFAGEIIFRRTGTLEISQLGGIRNVAPKFATCFIIVVLASVALPTTNAFIGEFLLLYGVYGYNTCLSIVAGLTIILGAAYMLKMYQNTMLGEVKTLTSGFADLSASELTVFVVLIIAIFVCGVYPKPIIDIAQPALAEILKHTLR
ncbi:MAG: NADH-quinone oxidoreductase subunit [Bacteroidetes bacterium]|nr:NADH-quinone oxidoreductase subunit [Bacteroidota bacterium]